MNKQSILKSLKEAREKGQKRKFSQTFDLIISLKSMNVKNTDEQVEFFVSLHHNPGKKRKVCALVGPEMVDKAKGVCDTVITSGDFGKYKDKKLLKKLAKTDDFFVAQADIMPKVAAAFGRALGPRGKMPNPKAGQILPPKATVQPVYDRLQKLVKISAKKQLAVQVAVGNESMTDDEVADNILAVYDQLIHNLPQEKNNVKGTFVKVTMGPPISIKG